ncbi:MAG: hypothetical protein WBZ37_02785 [Mycobacterium sp.]
MSRRGAMWPTELDTDDDFVELTPLAHWLFKLLWLHADLDSAGFLALQVEVWGKASNHTSPSKVEGMLDERIARGWVSVNYPTGELWVRSFIRLDASPRPNIFVAAMRQAETRRSRTLRAEAWAEIDRVYQQEPLKPPGDDADEKAWKFYTNQVKARDDAYKQLRAKVVREGFGNRSGTVREGFGNRSGTLQCGCAWRCGCRWGTNRPRAKTRAV